MNDLWCAVVTYNGARWIKDCMDSLLLSIDVTRIAIVDNASRDDTLKIVGSHFSGVHVISLTENKGFAEAANIAMSYALAQGAGCVATVNQDARVEIDTLLRLYRVSQGNPYFGMLVPCNLTDEKTTIDPTFVKEMIKYCPLSMLADFFKDEGREVYDVPVLPGAVLFYRREFLLDVGGFDPAFFLYGVEYELSLRAERSEWKVGFVPRARVYHTFDRRPKPGDQRRRKSFSRFFYSTAFDTRHRSFWRFLVNEIGYCIYTFIWTIATGRLNNIRPVIRMGLSALRRSNEMWQNRRPHLKEKGLFMFAGDDESKKAAMRADT